MTYTLRNSFSMVFHILLILPALLFLQPAIAQSADSHRGYRVSAGKIHDPTGAAIQIRGINVFGFNTEILQPHQLWSMGWKEQIAQIVELGFNAVRVPFVPATLYHSGAIDELSYVDPAKNPELIGKTPLEVLDLWLEEANRQGLYILLDFHSVSRYTLHQSWFVSDPANFGLTYDGGPYSTGDWIRDLDFVARRYAHLEHFFALDLFNEPHGQVRWTDGEHGVSDERFHWKSAAEKAAREVLKANSDLLIFVQGLFENPDGIQNSGIPFNWGENLQPQHYQPLEIDEAKLVLSPHTYGPDVWPKSSFEHDDFPENLSAHWELLFGRLYPDHAVVTGEWGGGYGNGHSGDKDAVWQNALVDYLISKRMTDSFYWAYAPNSGDTGGILDSDLKVREDKMSLLNRLWEAPSTPAEPEPDTGPEPEPVVGPITPEPLQSCAAILPLGDSITLGVNGGYRNGLYRGLQQNRCGVRFVGTQYDPNSKIKDKVHQGRSGFTISDIAERVPLWKDNVKPNIILLMAGTNDIAWWTVEQPEEIAARHDTLIDQLREVSPEAWIFVASIPPQSFSLVPPNNRNRSEMVEDFNRAIKDNVERRKEAGQPVRFVDVNAVLTSEDLYDGIHPDESAHERVAEVFLAAIRSELPTRFHFDALGEPPAAGIVSESESVSTHREIDGNGFDSTIEFPHLLRSEQFIVNVTLESDASEYVDWSGIELVLTTPRGDLIELTFADLESASDREGVSYRRYVFPRTGFVPSAGEWTLTIHDSSSSRAEQDNRILASWELQVDGTPLPLTASDLPVACEAISASGAETSGTIHFGVSQAGLPFEAAVIGGDGSKDYYLMADIEAEDHTDLITVVLAPAGLFMLTAQGIVPWDGSAETLQGLPNEQWNKQDRPLIGHAEWMGKQRSEIYFGYHTRSGDLQYCSDPVILDLT